jgi:hypothetical protein
MIAFPGNGGPVYVPQARDVAVTVLVNWFLPMTRENVVLMVETMVTVISLPSVFTGQTPAGASVIVTVTSFKTPSS